MDKREACHRLAEINEQINDIGDNLRNVELRLYSCKEEEREWYLEKKAELEEKLERYQQEHDEFISEYSDIIYS